MTARAHSSTGHVDTAVFDAAGLGAPLATVPAAPAPSPGASDGADAFEGDATEENPRQDFAAVEQPTPTEIDPSPPAIPMVSEPVRVISMKDHTEGQRPPRAPRMPLHVQLRSLAQVSGSHEVQPGLGHLAPPRDPARKREMLVGAQVVRACAAVLLAGSIALTIWLVFGR